MPAMTGRISRAGRPLVCEAPGIDTQAAQVFALVLWACKQATQDGWITLDINARLDRMGVHAAARLSAHCCSEPMAGHAAGCMLQCLVRESRDNDIAPRFLAAFAAAVRRECRPCALADELVRAIAVVCPTNRIQALTPFKRGLYRLFAISWRDGGMWLCCKLCAFLHAVLSSWHGEKGAVDVLLSAAERVDCLAATIYVNSWLQRLVPAPRLHGALTRCLLEHLVATPPNPADVLRLIFLIRQDNAMAAALLLLLIMHHYRHSWTSMFETLRNEFSYCIRARAICVYLMYRVMPLADALVASHPIAMENYHCLVHVGYGHVRDCLNLLCFFAQCSLTRREQLRQSRNQVSEQLWQFLDQVSEKSIQDAARAMQMHRRAHQESLDGHSHRHAKYVRCANKVAESKTRCPCSAASAQLQKLHAEEVKWALRLLKHLNLPVSV